MNNLLLSAPKVFGWQHLTFLAIFITLGILSVILIKKYCKSENSIKIAIKIYSSVLLFFILFNRISVAVKDNNFWHFIPNTFCGISSLALAICGIFAKKDSPVFHLFVYNGLLGGLLTMIYPDFLGQNPSFFYPATISGIMHHTILFFLSITIIVCKYMNPSLKKFKFLALGLCIMMVYGQFLMSVGIYDSAMYINKPVMEGTIFTWYVTEIIYLALVFVSLLIVSLIQKKKEKSKIESNETTLKTNDSLHQN